MPNQPPNVDGICSFIDDMMVCQAVQTKLTDIRSNFVATDDVPVCDIFYITATYNRTVAGTDIDVSTKYPFINGDTAAHCLAMADGMGAV